VLWCVAIVLAIATASVATQLAHAHSVDSSCADTLLELSRLRPEVRRGDSASSRVVYEAVVRIADLKKFIRPDDIVADARGIRVAYVRPIVILPRWHWMLQFNHDVVNPFH